MAIFPPVLQRPAGQQFVWRASVAAPSPASRRLQKRQQPPRRLPSPASGRGILGKKRLPYLTASGLGIFGSPQAGTHCFLSFHTTLCGLRKAHALVLCTGAQAALGLGVI